MKGFWTGFFGDTSVKHCRRLLNHTTFDQLIGEDATALMVCLKLAKINSLPYTFYIALKSHAIFVL